MDLRLRLPRPALLSPPGVSLAGPRRISALEVGLFALAAVSGIALALVGVRYSFAVALVSVAAVAGALVMVRRPEIGLLIVVFFVPLEDLNQAFTFGPLSVIKLLSLAVFAAYAAHLIVLNNGQKLVNVRQNLYIALFFAAVLISDLVALDPAYAVDKTLKILRMVGFYFLVLNIVRTRASVHRMLWVMIVAGFLCAVYGLYEYYFTPEVLDDMRVSGPLDDPVGFSYAMAILLPFVWYMWRYHWQPAVRLFLVVAAFAMLYGMILSGARSGMMAGLIALLLIAVRQKRAILNLALIGFVCVMALLMMPDHVRSRIGLSQEVDKAAQASTERRLTYQEFGLQLFLEDPFLGSGLGGFAETYSTSEYRFMRSEDDVRRIAHNMYLEIATGTGLLGLVPFLLIFGTTLAGLEKVIRRPGAGQMGDLAKVAQISLVTFLFAGFFSSSQYDKPLWLLLGLGSAIAAIAAREWDQTHAMRGL